MRRVLWVAGLMLAAFALVLVCSLVFWSPGARKIQGRTESEWIAFAASGPAATNIEQWQALGLDAVPILSRALVEGTAPAARWTRSHWYNLPLWMRKHSKRPQDTTFIRCNAPLILMRLTNDVSGAAPALGRALHDEDQNVRNSVADCLQTVMPKWNTAVKVEVVPDLLAAVLDTNFGVKIVPLQCLGLCPEQSRVIGPVLAQACDDSLQMNRTMAVVALKKMDPTEMAKGDVAPALMHCLGNADVLVCTTAAQLLSEMKCNPKQEVAAFTEMLGSPWPARQRIAAVALGKYGTAASSAVPALQHLFETGEPRAREAASNALAEIRK